MRIDGHPFKVAALAGALALASHGFASESQEQSSHAGSSQVEQGTTAPQASSGGISGERLSEIREKTVSADELLSADVYNVADPVGNVRDLVLSEDGRSVEYVVYEIPFPYAYMGAQNGFVAFENVEVNLNDGMFGSHVRFAGEPSDEASDTLTITRAEADDRLLSRLLGKTVRFEDDETRPLEDVLIDRQTGEISAYVVSSNPDSWFNEEPRIVRPDQVTIDDEGEVIASTEFAALEMIDSL